MAQTVRLSLEPETVILLNVGADSQAFVITASSLGLAIGRTRRSSQVLNPYCGVEESQIYSSSKQRLGITTALHSILFTAVAQNQPVGELFKDLN